MSLIIATIGQTHKNGRHWSGDLSALPLLEKDPIRADSEAFLRAGYAPRPPTGFPYQWIHRHAHLQLLHHPGVAPVAGVARSPFRPLGGSIFFHAAGDVLGTDGGTES